MDRWAILLLMHKLLLNLLSFFVPQSRWSWEKSLPQSRKSSICWLEAWSLPGIIPKSTDSSWKVNKRFPLSLRRNTKIDFLFDGVSGTVENPCEFTCHLIQNMLSFSCCHRPPSFRCQFGSLWYFSHFGKSFFVSIHRKTLLLLKSICYGLPNPRIWMLSKTESKT